MKIDITWRAGIILLSLAATIFIAEPCVQTATEWWFYVKTNSCRSSGVG